MKASPDLAVTRHPPIRDQIATMLRNAIVNLDFVPGQLLIERELCERTGASRPSVREALRQLEAEGLVESKNGRGTVVRVLDAHEIENVYEIRAELEGLAARLFCERATEDDRSVLNRSLDALTKATKVGLGQSGKILAAQQSFYSVLFAGAANPLLEQLVQGLQVRVAQLRAATLQTPGRAEDSLDEFKRIGAAIASRDSEQAEREAVGHVLRAAEVMRSARQTPPVAG